ncbi:site-specific DNA-methyltransferase [Pseudohalocynthiibacter aestuariivivens]|uniref:Methyltransferase n=1 Tax=Pseudohalocynthiibacter aestuariivivens TaxID=1591409 RepID=A0ABV5JFV0_9RHOB|nr:DNA methyltransferase [Pseudohalocynthiibacter aestuariivivens]MBS9718529.1 ParB N-terminal domain-containing protein [Pseudohalocynthiibacter aestuariivivens]
MYLAIEHIEPGKLKPSSRNARTHERRQVRQIAESIRQFGFANPVLVDEANILIAGHGRLEAALLLGLEQVPAIRLTHLSDVEKRALMLADNKIALNSNWDVDLLATELADLSTMNLDFELDLTGFEVAEIDLIIAEQAEAGATTTEEAPLPDRSRPPISRRGDLWLLGAHRVLCGDAKDPDDYAVLMDGEQANMGFTDPPYNVPIVGHVSGGGRVKHREFAEASGEMSSDEFEEFLSAAFDLAARHSRNGAVWFACIDWRHIAEMQRAGEKVFDAWLNLCVWAKTNGGMGSLYRSQHELVFVFRKGRLSHRNNVQLGKFGRNRTNLWPYPGVNTFRAGRMEELTAHPTAKPVEMIKDAILDVSKRGDLVLDPFLGAGATLIAAERSGRIARGLEIDPAYIDVILRRWRDETGGEPVRASDSCSLAELEANQLAEAGQ